MFEKIKENWQKRIERNAFKSTLTYLNRDGIKLMKEGYKYEDLPDNCKVTEEVIFKRSLLPLGDWTRIYPPLKENGRLNLFNLIFGGKRNFIKLIIVLLIAAFVFLQFYNNFQYIEILKTCTIPNCLEINNYLPRV
jgi:hypothetical protein